MFRHPMELPKVQAQLEEVQVEQFLDGGLQTKVLSPSSEISDNLHPAKGWNQPSMQNPPTNIPTSQYIFDAICICRIPDSPSTTRFHPLTCFPLNPVLSLCQVCQEFCHRQTQLSGGSFILLAPLYLYLSIYLSTSQPINQSIYLPICLSIYLSVLFADLPSPNGI